MQITIETKAPASLWILIHRLITILLVVMTTVVLVDGSLSFTLSYASRRSTPRVLLEPPRLRHGLRVWKFASIVVSGLLSFLFTLTYNFFEISLTLGTPWVLNVGTLSQHRQQELHSLRLGPLASYDLGRTPYATPDEDGSTGRTASHNADAGTGSADGTTGHGSADDNTGHGSAHDDAGHESADGNAGHGSLDGDLRDEFPWWDTEYGSAASEAASGSLDKDEDRIQERQSDNSPASSYRSLSQAGTAAPSTTTPTPITLLTGSDAVEFRESVINEVVSWSYAPNKDTIKRRLVFEYNGDGIPAPEEIDTECRKLEGWSIEGETFDSQRFRVYNSPDLFKHNLLKCWVYLNQHQMDGWWPRGYTPRFATLEGELPAGWVNTIDDDDRSILTKTTNR